MLEFDSILSALPVGVEIYSLKDGRLLDLNRRDCEIFGYTREQALKDRPAILDNPNIPQDFKDAFAQHKDIKIQIPYNFRLVKESAYYQSDSDKTIYLKCNGACVANPNGESEKYVFIIDDITASHEHEMQLEKSRSNLNISLEAGEVLAWSYDIAKDIFSPIQAGQTLPKSQVSFSKLLKIVHPDDVEKISSLAKLITSGKREKVKFGFRCRSFHAGEYRYFESYMMGRKVDGHVVEVVGTRRDITELHQFHKEMEQSFVRTSYALRSSNLVLWEYDNRTKFYTSFNDPVNDYNSNIKLTQADYNVVAGGDFSHQEDVQKALQMMDEGRDESFSFKMSVKTKHDQDWQYCVVSGMPLEKDNKGKIIKYTGIRRNYTEWYRLTTELMCKNEELQVAKEAAERSDKLKSAFLANISHEIRTPLNAIVGFSNLMQDASLEERKEYLRIISTNDQQLLRLIDDILDFSKMESGFFDFEEEDFDLSQLFDELASILKFRVKNSDVKFLCKIPYKSCIVRLDRRRVMQIITNFAENAIKYTEKGYIKIGYEYRNKGIYLKVEDTGCGIPLKEQNKVFDRFEKLNSLVPGTGLGLSICKAIAECWGGSVGASSTEGIGSTFWAFIPSMPVIVQ